MNKTLLRKQLREKRQKLTLELQDSASQAAAAIFSKQPEFVQARSIAGYMPINGEISPLPLLKLAKSLGKLCLLPVIASDKLAFSEYVVEHLTPNCYGILEPQNQPHTPLNQIDLVILPLVAFDKHGLRLGMGGGYYDRTFGQNDNSLLVGLGYDFQGVSSIVSDPWDIVMYGVITESSYRVFNP